MESGESQLEHAGEPAEFDELPTTGLLSFYDRLRARIVAAAESRGGRLARVPTETLLLIPDLFLLLARMSLDREVPREVRVIVTGALAYFILPVDLLPEAFVGPTGFVEDMVLACAVLSQVLSEDLEPFAERHWSGSDRLRDVLAQVSGGATALLGEGLYGRLRTLLARRGIRLDS